MKKIQEKGIKSSRGEGRDLKLFGGHRQCEITEARVADSEYIDLYYREALKYFAW